MLGHRTLLAFIERRRARWRRHHTERLLASLPPELRNILLMPIAPHFSMDRAVVLDEGTSTCIEVHSRHEAVISVDGMDPVFMNSGDKVRVTANKTALKMIRFQDRGYFYRNLALYTESHPLTGLKANGK